MILLYRCCRQAAGANTITAHNKRLQFTGFIGKRGIHSFAVFGAEFENMPSLNATAFG